MRRSELTLVIMELRTAYLRLATPCACGRQQCTLIEHIFDSTRNMTPGPHAKSFEPTMAGRGHAPSDDDPPTDTTIGIHDHFQALLTQGLYTARNISREVDRLRPDRYIPLPNPATDEDWCRNHLDLVGTCEPRKRGDLCETCYELALAYGTPPDRQCLQAIKDTGYKADRIIKDWVARLPRTNGKRKRKKAS